MPNMAYSRSCILEPTMFGWVKLWTPPTTDSSYSHSLESRLWLPLHASVKSNLTGAWLPCQCPAWMTKLPWNLTDLPPGGVQQCGEGEQHPLPEARRQEVQHWKEPESQNHSMWVILSNPLVAINFFAIPQMTSTGWCWSQRRESLTPTTSMLPMST